jgi:hypothetical protein
VEPEQLQVGEMYFAIQYLDDDLLVPIMTTLVFIGWNLGGKTDVAYLQDASASAAGAIPDGRA